MSRNAKGLSRRVVEKVLVEALRRADAATSGSPTEKRVHDQRKSLRRARALVRFFTPLLPTVTAKRVSTLLRTRHRATSGRRDADILRQALEQVTDDSTRRAAAHAAELIPPSTTQPVPGGPPLAPLAARVARGLPRTISEKELRACLARCYRQARRAFRTAFRGGEEPLHEWRKRAKELSHQLELVPVGRGWSARLRQLGEELGEITDLLVLEAFVTANAAQLGEDAQVLERRISELCQGLAEQALVDGQRLFTRSPKKFTKKATA